MRAGRLEVKIVERNKRCECETVMCMIRVQDIYNALQKMRHDAKVRGPGKGERERPSEESH